MLIKSADYIIGLENKGLLVKNTEYTIIGHSLGGPLALLVTNKIRARHIIQVSAPNDTPLVASISGLGYIPVLLDLRNIQTVYQKVKPVNPIGRLTTLIPKDDQFIGTDVQGGSNIPQNFQVQKRDGTILQGGHIDPILTPGGIKEIVKAANF